MYKLLTANSKAKKRLQEYLLQRGDIPNKLDLLKLQPRKANGAHPLHGRLSGKWSCWLGSNIRVIYSIDDTNKVIFIEAVGPHNIYG